MPLFGQTFSSSDLAVIGLLIVLEGVLSIDNALVLGLLAKRLPKRMQKRALTYGLVGAFVFRFLAIGTASYLLRWRVVKLLGGGYLVYIALKHFLFDRKEEKEEHITVDADEMPTLVDERTGAELNPQQAEEELRARSAVAAAASRRDFWSTVAVIELTDVAFAIDSILAAIALVGSAPAGHVGPHPKLWVVVTGGILGVVLMRFAAVMFISLLEKFPRFETAAYLLVTVIGLKLLADWGFNTAEHPHAVDFHSPGNPAFWIFWIAMLACFCTGFLPQKKKTPATV
jgi:YkoY family integral membrane protein